MFGMSHKSASTYAKVGLETGVVASTPHQLIVMLFDGALVALRAGVSHMKAGEIQKKGMAISKAILIVENGLRASLDKNAGGQIAESLDALYEYMGRRMLFANVSNQPDVLEEVITLLTDLKTAWDAIGPQVNPVATPQSAQRPAAYDSLAPRTVSFSVAG